MRAAAKDLLLCEQAIPLISQVQTDFFFPDQIQALKRHFGATTNHVLSCGMF